jgi:hypothetical protein
MGGRISLPIWIAGVAALLMSGIGTDLQATTGANDCLAAPNASSPRGQHWYYRTDLPNHRKCWYLHATQKALHRATRPSEFHAVSTAADTPVSESPAVNAPRLPHTRILSVKPQPTSLVSAIAEEPIQRSDPPLAPQENAPQESALQVDGSKPTDAVAAPSPAAAKPIEQSDAPWIPQESGPQEGALQVDGSKPTDAVAAPSPAAAKPIEQGDAPWIPQESGPQEGALQVVGSKPTDAVAASSPAAAKPIEQGDAPWIPQESGPQEGALQVVGSKPTAASSPAPATFRVAAAGADSAPPDAGAEAFDDGGRIAERSTPTTQAGILGTLSFTPVQMFLLLVFGLASVVFLVSLVIISQRDAVSIDFQLGGERPDAQATRGWQDDGARSSQMFVDGQRGQDGIDAPPWRMRPSATRPQDGNATPTEPPRSSLEDVKAALEDFKAALIYEDRTQRLRRGPESPMAP